MTELLFSYGTLRSEPVQMASFGRILNGEKDYLNRYRITMLKITDPDVLAKSGEQYHPAAIPSWDEKDSIEGMVFEISADELALADAYEVDDYIRTSVVLASGKRAWIYILKTYALQTRRAVEADAKPLSDRGHLPPQETMRGCGACVRQHKKQSSVPQVHASW